MLSLAILGVGAVSAVLAFNAIRRPGFALPFVWAMFGMEQLLQTKLPVFVVHPLLANIIPIAICLMAIVCHQSQSTSPFRLDQTQWFMITLFGLAVASSIWANSSRDAIEQLIKFAPYLVGFCIIGPLCINSTRDLNDAFSGFVILSIPVLAGLAVAPMHGRGIILLGRALGNPLATGSLGASAVVIAGCRLMYDRRVLPRILCVTAATLGIYVCLRSGSRGQFIAAVSALAVGFFVTTSVIRRRSALVPLVAIATLMGLASYLIDEIAVRQLEQTSRWDAESMIAAVRGGRMKGANELFRHYVERGPVTWFSGLGTSSSFSLIGYYCHVVPIEVLCELGILGILLFSIIQLKGVAAAWKLIHRERISEAYRATIGTMLSFFACFALLQFKQGSMLGSYELLSCAIVLSRVATLSFATLKHGTKTPIQRATAQLPSASPKRPTPTL